MAGAAAVLGRGYMVVVAHEAPSLVELGLTRRFLTGASYPFKGIRLVLTQPATWPYLIAPTLITAAVFLTSLFVTWHAVAFLLELLWEPTVQHHWLIHLAWRTTTLLIRALAFLVIGVGLYFTAGIVAIPFNDRLSEHIETLCLGPYEEAFSWRVLLGDVAVSVLHTLLSATLWLSVMGALLFLELVPILGSALHLALGTLATSLFLAREVMDGCLSRRRMAYRHKLKVVNHNFWMAVGFGTVASLMLWIPGLNFVLFPMIVAGGSMMYCHLESQALVPNASGTAPFVPERARVRQLADQALAEELESLDVFAHAAAD